MWLILLIIQTMFTNNSTRGENTSMDKYTKSFKSRYNNNIIGSNNKKFELKNLKENFPKLQTNNSIITNNDSNNLYNINYEIKHKHILEEKQKELNEKKKIEAEHKFIQKNKLIEQTDKYNYHVEAFNVISSMCDNWENYHNNLLETHGEEYHEKLHPEYYDSKRLEYLNNSDSEEEEEEETSDFDEYDY